MGGCSGLPRGTQRERPREGRGCVLSTHLPYGGWCVATLYPRTWGEASMHATPILHVITGSLCCVHIGTGKDGTAVL